MTHHATHELLGGSARSYTAGYPVPRYLDAPHARLLRMPPDPEELTFETAIDRLTRECRDDEPWDYPDASGWTHEDLGRAVEMYCDGVSASLIAQSLGKSVGSVAMKMHALYRRLRGRKTAPTGGKGKMRKRHVSLEQELLIEQLRLEGQTYREISERVGCTQGVAKWCCQKPRKAK